MRRTSSAIAVAAIAVAGLAATMAATVGPASAAPSTGVVVSEAYGGGGNSGATLTNDFIELYNRAGAASSLTGWSVQYLSGTPSASSKWSVTPLAGSIAAGKSYLVGESKGTGGTQALPTPDTTGSIAMGATSGTVALVNGTTPLSCLTAADCAADTSVVDLVGYGGAVVREGNSAPAASATTSVQRKADGTDTDDNAVDFTAAAPTPQNSGSDGGGGTEVRIHDIQGTSWVSPLAGQAVTDVPGIVTAVRKSGSSKGFWIQDPTPDDNPATSEGVYVYTGGTPTVTAGDSVTVSGTVSDYYALSSGETLSTTSSLSVTEIGGSPTVTVVSSGNPLPAALVLKPDTVPSTYAPDLGGGNIESTPITPSRSALDFYESIEGMRVEVDNGHVVGPSNQYGEQYVTTKPKQAITYRGGTLLLGDNRTPSGRLEIATLDGSKLGLDVGDVLGGKTVGPIDWSTFGGYVLEAAQVGTPVRKHLPPVTATPGTEDQLSIATYNVENLSPADPASKFQALAAGVVTNLASPDVVALEEIQDNDGPKDDGVVSADQTLTELTDAIKAAGGPQYTYSYVNPINDQDGGQPGGNIRNAFLFNGDRVSLTQRGGAKVDRSTTATGIKTVRGKAALTLSPGRIDPTNPVWTDSRKPLAGEFLFHGKSIIVIANHFDSKGGDQNADGRFQYPKQSSRTQRAGQAQVVHDFVQKTLATDPGAQVAVVGDLNDYQFSPPLAVLRTGSADGKGTPILTDLITTLPQVEQYTYVYNGISQVLDHILTTPAVSGIRYQVVHVNAEYSDQVSDHDPQVVDITLGP